MQEGQTPEVENTPQVANPILAALSSQAQEPIPEPQGGQEEISQASDESNPQSEGEIQNTDSENKLNSQEATELETTEGDNSSDSQGLGNEEGETASTTSDVEWYNQGEEETTVSSEETDSVPVDYSDMSKALGIEGSTKDDVISKINELNSQNQEYAEKIKKLEEQPQYVTPELQQAVEIARNGGDYMNYLGLTSNNWDAIPDDTLIAEAKLKPAFGEDVEKMNNYLNEMDPVQKQLQAAEIRNSLRENDEYQKQQLIQQAQERKVKIDSGIKSTLDSLNDIYGVKVTPAMRKEAYDDITYNNHLSNMFTDKNGNPSPQKMIEVYMQNKYLKKIVQTNVNNARNSGIQEVLDEASNPKISRRGEMVDSKPKEPLSPFQQRMANLKAGK